MHDETMGLGTMPGPVAHSRWLRVVGNGEPEAVAWDTPSGYRGDSGFVLFLAGHEEHEGPSAMACEACAVDTWPHLATAMNLARNHGVAILNGEGVWVGDPA